jgi:hypothetical protein
MAQIQRTATNSILPASTAVAATVTETITVTATPDIPLCQPIIFIKWLGMEAAGLWGCALLIIVILGLLVLAYVLILGVFEFLRYQLISKP